MKASNKTAPTRARRPRSIKPRDGDDATSPEEGAGVSKVGVAIEPPAEDVGVELADGD
jgi:hypothetical protein